MKIEEITKLFNLGRKIEDTNNNPYLYFAKKHDLNHYRLISSGELLVRGKDLNIPEYIKQYIKFHKNALMIANFMGNKVISIVFRNLTGEKEFMKLGITKSTFYGLGQLSPNFRYGQPILLVEGHLDRDKMATMFHNTLGIMTSSLSESQINILRGLTNKIYLMLDNDDAGRIGTKKALRQLKNDFRVKVIEHDSRLKDAGELVKLEMQKYYDLNYIENFYRAQLN